MAAEIDIDGECSRLFLQLREVQPFSMKQGLLSERNVAHFVRLISDVLSLMRAREIDGAISADLIAATREEIYYGKKQPRKSEDYRGPYTEIAYRSDRGFFVFREDQAFPAYEDVECGALAIRLEDANGRRIAPFVNRFLSVAPFDKINISGDTVTGYKLELIIPIERLERLFPDPIAGT